MNILVTVCGRAGSKGVKNKNLKEFLGSPLVHYTLAAVNLYTQKYGKEDIIQTCLNTDSKELIDIVRKYKQDVFVVNRIEVLCGDYVSKKDVMQFIRLKISFNFVFRLFSMKTYIYLVLFQNILKMNLNY